MKSITDEQKDAVRALSAKGMTLKEISKQAGIGLSSVWGIVNKQGKLKPRKTEAIPVPDDPNLLCAEIHKAIEELEAVYTEKLKAIRVALIGARARLQERE